MKKILITSTDVMMYLFLIPHIRYLADHDYIVDVACSSAEGFKSEDYENIIRERLPCSSQYFHISSERSPYSISNIKGFIELRSIIKNGGYDLVWTNEPVMGVITRLAANKFRKNGLKVLYLAHGYHFFKGAPVLNWGYYPVEKICSYLTDMLVMINWEDYRFTQKHMSTPVSRIDGIGFDLSKYQNVKVDYKSKRHEIGVKTDEILILSVGELMTRKNHEAMIKAIALVNNPKIKYVICGVGDRLSFLENLVKKLELVDSVKFIGLRYDVPELLQIADIFAHPSKREGLGIAPLEAMAAGLPIVTSNAQGIKDYSVDGVTGYSFEPNDVSGYASAIHKLAENTALCKKIGQHNTVAVEKWSIENSTSQIENILHNVVG